MNGRPTPRASDRLRRGYAQAIALQGGLLAEVHSAKTGGG